MGINLENRVISNVNLKNIPTKLVISNHIVKNLGDTHLMSSIIYMIVNDGYTYVFMFNASREALSGVVQPIGFQLFNLYFR